MDKAYVQVYTGDGKGKTTAAVGLCLRALGAGLAVYIGQFIKAKPSSEITGLLAAVSPTGRLTARQFGLGRFPPGAPSKEDVDAARAGLAEAREATLSSEYDLVVLDEACVAVARGLVSESEILGLMADRPRTVELVLTGRYATRKIIDAADLVTEMREVKHYAASGAPARAGMEL